MEHLLLHSARIDSDDCGSAMGNPGFYQPSKMLFKLLNHSRGGSIDLYQISDDGRNVQDTSRRFPSEVDYRLSLTGRRSTST